MSYDGEIRISTKLDNTQLNTDLQSMTGLIGQAMGGIDLSLAGVSASILSVAKSSFDVGTSFESAFAGVKKTVDATDIELAELREQFRGLALEIPITADEFAGIGEVAGQLGIAKENILSFTKTMADLGVATNLTAEQAATEFARFANITQMPQENFDKLGSTVVALGNNLATTEAEISGMALRLAAAGTQAGLTSSEIFGFAGALSSVGIEAEAGGTAFSKVFTNIQLAVETGSKDLEMFSSVAGMTTAEFARAFEQDAAGAITAFVTGLSNVEQNGMSAIQVLAEMDLTEVRLRDSLLRASGAGELFASSISLANQAWTDNTALTNEASQRYGTMDSQIQLLKNSMADLGITVYDSIREPISLAIQAVQGLIQGFQSLPEPAQKFIVQAGIMTGVLGGVHTAMQTINAVKEVYASVTAKVAAQEATALATTNSLTKAQEAQAVSTSSIAKALATEEAAYSKLTQAKYIHESASVALNKAEIEFKELRKGENWVNYREVHEELTRSKKEMKAATQQLTIAEKEAKTATEAVTAANATNNDR